MVVACLLLKGPKTNTLQFGKIKSHFRALAGAFTEKNNLLFCFFGAKDKIWG